MNGQIMVGLMFVSVGVMNLVFGGMEYARKEFKDKYLNAIGIK